MRFPMTLCVAAVAAGCVHARPRPDVRPRRDGVLSIRGTLDAPASPAAAAAKTVVVWVPVPRDETIQVLRGQRVTLPSGATAARVEDAAHGNAALRIEIPAGVPARFEIEYALTRGAERAKARLPSAPAGTGWDGKAWMSDEGLAIVDDRIRGIAADIFAAAPDDDAKARAAFEYVLGHMRYSKEGTGWGTGSTKWACDSQYGNCTDFHALFIALLHAGGVPARFRIGFPLPAGPARDAPIAGYHCWAEYYSRPAKRWIPIDASEAWKHPEKRGYLFGHLDPDRVGMTLGRDLTFPSQRGLPLNYFVLPYAEEDGAAVRVATQITWTDGAGLPPAGSASARK